MPEAQPLLHCRSPVSADRHAGAVSEHDDVASVTCAADLANPSHVHERRPMHPNEVPRPQRFLEMLE